MLGSFGGSRNSVPEALDLPVASGTTSGEAILAPYLPLSVDKVG